jgi:hypothetical protein
MNDCRRLVPSALRTSPVFVLLASVLVVACGESRTNGEADKNAARVLEDSRAAARSADGVHAYGTLELVPRIHVPSGITFDVHDNGNREGWGTMTIQGWTVEVRSVGDNSYARGAAGFYTAFAGEPPAHARLMANKWLILSPADDLARLIEEVTDIRRLVGDSTQPLGAVRKGTDTSTDGLRAMDVVISDPSGLNYSTVYVATVGKPYPIRITGTPGAVSADVHFEAWNEPVKVRAPAGAVWWDSIP